MKNVENENDAIRNLNQKFKKQTSHEQQKTVDSSCISFYASSEKRQLKSSQVDKKRCQLWLSKWTSCKMLYKFSTWTRLSNFDQSEHKNGRRAWPTPDYGEKGEKHLSSLLVILNNWLNFRVRDPFEIKMSIARGHSDINTTPSVIMSLFCCRTLSHCLCISFSRCLCLFISRFSSVSFYLPLFFTIIFSPSSLPDSFCSPAFLPWNFLCLLSTLSCSACQRSSLTFSLFVLALSLSTCRLSSLKFCLLLLLLTRSLWRSSSLALRLFPLALCLRPVVYTLKTTFCCLLT